GGSPALAQPEEPENSAASTAQLESRQRTILDNYSELEQLLLQMAEYLGTEDPHRAALLRKAFQLSGENATRQRLEELVELLARDERASTLRAASKSQQQVQADLESLLKLLMSENRAQRNQDEQRRIRKYLERVNKVIRKQRAITDQTRRSEPNQQSQKQGELADETSRLQGDLADDPAASRTGEEDDKANAPPEQPKAESPDAPGKPHRTEGSDADGQPGDTKPDPNDAKPIPSKNPTAERLRAAEHKMREAQKDLEDAQRDGALEKQKEALRNLEQAKAELERILRQLRIEEDEQQLELLEARFKAILKLERKVHEGTVRLDRVAKTERDADDEIEASRLARSQNEIIGDVDRALLLLREEGSAVALTEVVTQMRDDMQQIAQRLARQQTGELTQSIEQDVLASLEEILAALDKAIKDTQQQKQNGAGQPGTPQDPPLVDTIAELKMLRYMQFRVRRRTAQYNKMLEEATSQATKPELLKALERLAQRQNRIFRATRDISTGMNR
ncbi:MAG: hypothetical protein MI757_18425, partial [Pirellulales bacterium]|nr:hypothetical protein [Pirellulales bacterium]